MLPPHAACWRKATPSDHIKLQRLAANPWPGEIIALIPLHNWDPIINKRLDTK